MNYNQGNSMNNNPSTRRQKTVPLNPPNIMNPNQVYNNNNQQYNQNNPNQYNQNNAPNQYSQQLPPRTIKSPRAKRKKASTKSKSKKDKRNKNNNTDNSTMHRPRSKTTGHNLSPNPMNDTNIQIQTNPNNVRPLYMSTTQHIPPPPNNNINNNNNNMYNTNYNQPQRVWNNPMNNNNINNPNMAYSQKSSTEHHASPHSSGTIIQHESGNISNISNMSSNMINGPLSPSAVGSIHSAYKSRQECVWSIKLFQQQDVASNFSCQTCCDIPRFCVYLMYIYIMDTIYGYIVFCGYK